MKAFLIFLTLLSFSLSWAARLGPGDDPIPFPLNQAPSDLVGHWNGPEADQEIVVKLISPKKGEKTKLFVTTYQDGQKNGQGYLYFSDNKMYCGYIHHSGPAYTLCIWKEEDILKAQTLRGGQWQETLWTH
ncbi:MAG: hypothetical protein JSU04_17630 [Bdellovibrionales bacterium]|nr:hypothetical protein [Bdellovibrionales bacterium]